MTVKELSNVLKHLPQDAEIYVVYPDLGCFVSSPLHRVGTRGKFVVFDVALGFVNIEGYRVSDVKWLDKGKEAGE